MKKITIVSMLVAAAAIAFPSCAKVETESKIAEVRTFRITASSADTKTVFGAKDVDRYPTLWTTNKQVSFSCNEEALKYAYPESAGKTTTFEVSFVSPAESGTIYAFSPKGVYDGKNPANCVPGFTGINTSYHDVYLNIPSAQTPLANSVDESAQAIVATASYSDSDTDVSMTFRHVVAYGKMTITNFAGTIKSVELQFPENIAGSGCYYYYKTGELSNTSTNSITLDPTNVVGNVFWFALAPTSGNSGTMRIILTDTNDDTYTKTLNLGTKALPFVAGKISSFTANFNGIKKDGETGITWLELPSQANNADFTGTFYSSGIRNYSYTYDYDWYASMWVAYPLTHSNTVKSIDPSKNWSFNTDISTSYQVHIVSSSYPTMYGASEYARGHQIPNADRYNDLTMNNQTYLATNQTPQLQNKFNASIWGLLETAVRDLTDATDTVYVVTGPTYRKVGGEETINYLNGASGKSAVPSKLAIPNYYWKVLLKVKRDSHGNVTSASTIGFWFEHKEYSSSDSYTSYALSVDQIEQWTGFDFFVNLPDALETAAERNTSWSNFKNF